MVQMAITVLPVFGQRQWALWPVAADATSLICSDAPVSLTWTREVADLHPPGFGLPNTLVTVPLNARMVLASTFEPLKAVTLDQGLVAQVNSRTGMLANQLFSPEDRFV
jgi:hypothetical protein